MSSVLMEMDSLYQKALKLKGSGDLNEAANQFSSCSRKSLKSSSWLQHFGQKRY